MSKESFPPFPWQNTNWSKLVSQFNENRLSHAYLLTGTAGIGKFEFALKFARYLICSFPGSNRACGACKHCHLSASLNHPDIQIVTPEDNDSVIKIDQVRNLANFYSKTSHAGTLKIAIINHVHRLNPSAANALLKTLEEPAGSSILFLCTNLPGQLKSTISSRCQKFPMGEASRKQTLEWLEDNMSAPFDSASLEGLPQTRPLYVKELVESGTLETQQEFIKGFLKLLNREASIQSVLSDAQTLGLSNSISFLMNFFSKAIVAYMSNQTANRNSIESIFIQMLQESPIDRRELAVRLINFYDEVAAAQKDLSGSNNLNAQLIVESLIWRGSMLNLR